MTNDHAHVTPLSQDHLLSNGVYDTLKKLVQIIIPAFSALYFTMATIWGWPGAEQVMASLAAIATFLGVLIGLSNKSYNNSESKYDGQMIVVQNDDTGSKVFSLELNGDPANLPDKKDILFKVSSDHIV